MEKLWQQLSAISNGRTCCRQKFAAKFCPLYLKESFMLLEGSTKNYPTEFWGKKYISSGTP